MSRLYRGRRLLQNELREFAKSQGLIKEDTPAREGTINLNEYRRSQEDKISQS